MYQKVKIESVLGPSDALDVANRLLTYMIASSRFWVSCCLAALAAGCLAQVAPPPPKVSLNQPRTWKLSGNGTIKTWVTLEVGPAQHVVVDRVLHPSTPNLTQATSNPSFRAGWTATYNQLRNALTFRDKIKSIDPELGFIDVAKGTLDEVTLQGRQSEKVPVSGQPSLPTDALEVIAEQQLFKVKLHFVATRGAEKTEGVVDMAELTYTSAKYATRTVPLKIEATDFDILALRNPVPREQAEGICLVTPSGYIPIPTNLVQKLDLTARCKDMLHAVFSAANASAKEIEVAVMPGTILRSKDESFQNMIVVSEARLKLPGRLSFGPSVAELLGEQRVEATADTHCLNFTRHIPNLSKDYEVVTGVPLKLAKIAQFNSGMTQRGPWDQLRTWLFTDRVTLDQAQQTLNPAPGEGMYVRETTNMFIATQEDPSSPEYKQLFEAKLLNGHTNSVANALWYINQLAKDKPDDLALWIGGENKIEAMLNDNREPVQAYVAGVMNHLFSQPNKGIRMAALKFLGEKLSDEELGILEDHGGLDGAFASMQGTDSEEAALAIRIARKMKSQGALFSARNVNTKLPKTIQNEAAKLATELR